jgi:DNA modification methylase
VKYVATHALTLHPEAGRVPEMPADQFRDFVADIRERGVLVPIEVISGKTILDGRTRWMAAKRLGIRRVPVVAAPVNDTLPVIYMLRAASKRRHLSDDQRACLAQEEMEYLAAQNRQVRARLGGTAGGRGRQRPQSLPINAIGKQTSRNRDRESRTVVAKSYGISHRKVNSASQLRRDAPKLYRRVKAGNLRLAEAKREAERAAKRERQRELSRLAAKSKAKDPRWQILVGDCIKQLQELEPASARLIFADPPYNIGVDYGRGAKADSLPEAVYLTWCQKWLNACGRLLTDDGSLWVMINDDYADHFGLLLRHTGLHRRAWIKWYETFGVNCTNNFNRCSRHIFYCVKNPRRFVFNSDAVSRPSDRQLKYADKRAAPHGKLWDNVWCIPRLVENSKERLPDFPTQLPLDLLRPIIACASNPGDLVVDPFSGSGTTGAACVELQREFIGIERNKSFATLSERRLLTLNAR